MTNLETCLREMLGPEAGVGCAEITGTADGLWPEEEQAVTRAIAKRQAEFAAGRRAARQALTGIGIAPVAVPVGGHRQPLWPDGVTGAITHDAGVALAAVTPTDRTIGLGIDVTLADPLPEKTRAAILTHSAEQSLNPPEERAVFSAKESLFKALFPQLGTYFGFDAASVAPDLATGRFEITLTRTLGEFQSGQRWTGRLGIVGPCLISALVCRRRGPLTR